MAVDVLPPPGEFRTTEEIRDAKYVEELRRKRRRMLLWSAPVLVIALLVAIKLLSAVVINAAGTSAYENANHNTAADRFERLEVVNVVEPWKAHFNQGTAIYASGQFFDATAQLKIALDLVPKAPDGEPRGAQECDVRTNYSLALEGLGDEALAIGDPAMGTSYFTQAQTMLADCGESGGNGGEEAQEAEERQEQSQEQSQEQQEQEEQEGEEGESESPTDGESGEGESESPTDGQSGEGESESPTDGQSGEGESETPTDGQSGEGESETPTDGQSGEGESESPTESQDPREEELESRNSEAQESREAEEQASGGGDGSGQNW